MGLFVARAARAVTAVAVTAAMTVAVSGSASAATRPRAFVPPPVPPVSAVPGVPLRTSGPGAALRRRIARQAAAALRAEKSFRPHQAWPSPGSGTAVLPATHGTATERRTAKATAAVRRAAAVPVPAGSLPVTVARDSGTVSGLSRVRVSLLSHAAAKRAGVPGVLFTIRGTGASTGTVNIALRYRKFRNAGGADFGSRLRLVELPACAVTTPKVPACQVQTPLRSVNDAHTSHVSATVPLTPSRIPAAQDLLKAKTGFAADTPAVNSSLVVLASSTTTSGDNGSYSATSLTPAGSWSAGGSSGDFTWSYPITVPPPAAGTAPKVSLSYDSATVDGLTGLTNSQQGMVGQGFTLSQNYIEQTFTDCADDPIASQSGDYDNCLAGNVVSMSLNGHSTQLIPDASSTAPMPQTWHEESDTGDRVEYLKGTSATVGNGTYDNDYWVITTPDGTQYYFGKNKGPGWGSGDPVTNSAWTEPVYRTYSTSTSDSCYSSVFANSVCTQAWRWNLDFVISPNGNTTAYYYTPETNYYGADGGTTGVMYDRGGYLAKIEYGLRDESGSVYAATADQNPPDEVLFGATQRCISTSTFTCSASNFNSTNASYWPDTPEDLLCTASQACNTHSPSFWSQMRIESITTQYYDTTTSSYAKVDSYSFGQAFGADTSATNPDNTAGSDKNLRLVTITRTGYPASGSAITLPPVDLHYYLFPNRVPTTGPDMAQYRLVNIVTDTGEAIAPTYSTDCTASNVPSSDPSTNTHLCYPIYWVAPSSTSSTKTLDYFDKYQVTSVSVSDAAAGSPSHLTDYTYANPAWHYDNNQVVLPKYRTYGQFRGYQTVQVLTGNTQTVTNGVHDAQTKTETTYYQGMDGDPLPDGSTSSVTIQDSLSDPPVTDSNALAGDPLEVRVFNGATGGAKVSDKITEWQVTAIPGTETVSGLPDLQASMTGVTSERDFTELAGGGNQVLTTDTTYDGTYGRPILSQQTGTGIPETCTQTSYINNTTAWIMDAVSEVETAQQQCPASGSVTAADVISGTRTYFDGATSLTTEPTAGNPTEQDSVVTNSSGTLTWQTQWTKTYDSSGRVKTTTDGLQHSTSTQYTPSDGEPLTAVTTTNALTQQSTQTFDPGRGSLLTSTSVAGDETSYSYDALGRVTGVWKPGRSQAGDTPNIAYSYFVSQTAPPYVTTKTLVDYGSGTNQVVSVSFYDSLGQLRQVQTAAEDGDMVVSNTSYDSHGWKGESDSRWVVSGTPLAQPKCTSSPCLLDVDNAAMHNRVQYFYDGAGRVTDQQDYNGTQLINSVQTVQGGAQVTSIEDDRSGNPIGTPSATVTNVLGQVTQRIQYAGTPSVSSSSVVSGGSPQTTAFIYDAAGNRVSITDPKSNTWTYTYDLLGQQTQATDPDTGTTNTMYDAVGNVASTDDANGTKVNYAYDKLNRKTAEYKGSTVQKSGTEVAAWTWDTAKKGYLSSETAITANGTYKTGVLGYNAEGEPTGTAVLVPSGQPLAGTYKTGYSYSTTGLLLGESQAAGGGLPADSLTWTYDGYGNPVTETGYDTYVSGASWTPFNQVSQIELGTGPSAASLTYGYDQRTGAVTSVNMSDNEPAPQVDDTAYTYNDARQVIKISDTQGDESASPPVETQCFVYGSLSRLQEAWSASAANGCTSATDPATAGNSVVTGPQPYWQSWKFDELGDIKSRTDHASAGSSAGDTTTSYSYQAATGQAHAVSQVSASNTVTGTTATTAFGYNPNGSMSTMGSTALTWNYNGTLASAGNDSYVYNADGKELAETTSAGTTLFLPGEQLTSGSSGTTGMRYYTFAGVTVAESTGSGLYWTETGLHGTLTAVVDAFNESAPATYRTLTPYGQVVTSGGTPAWPDDRTFLNDPASPDTGLVDVGARKYDPALGLFTTVDPVLDAAAPQTMTGYTYAGDNPVSNADPTGLYIPNDGSTGKPSTSPGGGGGSGSSCGRPRPFCAASTRQRLHPAYNAWHNPMNVIAGFGAPIAGLGDAAVCGNPLTPLLACAYLAISGHLPSQLYTKWVASQGIDTSFTSGPYGFGEILANIALIGAGGLVGVDAAATSVTDTATTDLAAAPETFFRTMSNGDYATLQASGRVPASAKGETMISPTQSFSSNYEGTMVRFSVRPGTTDALAGVGVRDTSALTSAAYPDMPPVSKGWMRTSAFFKGEGVQVNIGLGRGTALDIFNNAIMDFEEVPR